MFDFIFFAVLLLAVAWRVALAALRGPTLLSDRPPGTRYQELMVSPVPTDFPGQLEVVVHPEAVEFGWRSHWLDQARAKGVDQQIPNGINWVTVPIHQIEHIEPRRMPLAQAGIELLNPYLGMGLTGEWKFRVRGVRTGVAIRTKHHVRYWIATRDPDSLIAPIHTLRAQTT